MSQSFSHILIHCVWSTDGRRPLINDDLQARLFPYLGGIAREHGMSAYEVGGMSDHVHALIRLSSTLSIAKAVQLLKGSSSKWVHKSFPAQHAFAWQHGYGAFSVGASQVERTSEYILNQAEHHRTRTFQEEFIQFLETHGVEYDRRYIWT